MNLAHDTRMIHDASFLNPFRLLPLEKEYRKLKAEWTFIEIDGEERIIQFLDKSLGDVEMYFWDFGDGNFSSKKNPIHRYSKAGEWTVKLCVQNSEGENCLGKVWDVTTK